MNLRVFSTSTDNLLVEISHPLLREKTKWVLPMMIEGDWRRHEFSESVLTVAFEGERYTIPFLRIGTIHSGIPRLTLVGALEEEDSRNILNNILDVMAWD